VAAWAVGLQAAAALLLLLPEPKWKLVRYLLDLKCYSSAEGLGGKAKKNSAGKNRLG